MLPGVPPFDFQKQLTADERRVGVGGQSVEARCLKSRVKMDSFDSRITRRRFGATVGYALASIAFGDGCLVSTKTAEDGDGRLTARPRSGIANSLRSGPLGLGDGRDGVIQMPPGLPQAQVPLLLFLHGATQSGAVMLRRIGAAADQAGVAVLAPDSRGTTWDAIRGGFGDDVAFLNRALDHVFAHLPVDPARLTIGGFSDGASYALSLGLANGDLFPSIVAFSPGFVISAAVHGRPRFFVSHGTSDQILPIDQTSRVIVPRLRSMGYDVTFREFEGRHELPPDVANEGLRWMGAI
jgi:phospholipase/carboxylesterase